MSDRFGFDLSMETVRLMRREGGHWREIASEPIEGTDIETRLQALADRVPDPKTVDIFLPRDQILYTDVRISSEKNAPDEIDAAMEGRTPYALDELEIDWAIAAPDTARVAAVARETLDEALEFARARGLRVDRFSSLADPGDFPRQPDFGGDGLNLFVEAEVDGENGEDADAPDAGEVTESADGPDAETPVPTFHSRREADPRDARLPTLPLRPDPGEGPVVKVDDPTPVMELPDSGPPALDPGPPLPRPTSEPRVVTDIGADAAAPRAASLTAPAPVRIRHGDRALPSPLLVVLAALLSIGIAVIIWSILPSVPDTSRATGSGPAPADIAQSPDVQADEGPDPASVAPRVLVLAPAPSVLPPAAPLPALPGTDGAPVAGRVPQAPAAPPAAGSGPGVPGHDPGPLALTELQAVPQAVLAAARLPAPDRSENIVTAAFEPPHPATDAFALPRTGGLLADVPPPASLPPAPPREPGAAAAPGSVASAPADGGAPGPDIAALPSGPRPGAAGPVDEPPAVEDEPAPGEPEVARLVPTALARSVPRVQPAPRPGDVLERIERLRFGGRTVRELSRLRPPGRPASAQAEAESLLASRAASALAVSASPLPRSRPGEFDAIVAAVRIQQEAARQAAALAASVPDTTQAIQAALADEIEDAAAEESGPVTRPQDSARLAIPSEASVARQATLEDAIRLNRVTLVGVYGLPSDRRALVRLPSGRYVKVKVGDRLDGGEVAAIGDGVLQYVKKGRTIALSMPKG